VYVIFLYIFLTAMVFAWLGFYIGGRIQRSIFHGLMIVEETPNGMTYRLEVAGDLELLAFEDHVNFKVVGPDYAELMSRQKLGV
jgi:hypothetical protein